MYNSKLKHILTTKIQYPKLDHKKNKGNIKMFNSFKKARNARKESKNTLKELEQQGINTKCFKLFLQGKGVYIKDTTPELIQEFNNRDDPIEKIPVSCRITLPEMYSNVNNVAGAMVGAVTGTEHNFTSTSREQITAQTLAIIVPNGLVFKGALNKTEDLRIKWEDITDCKISIANRGGVFGNIRVGAIDYRVSFINHKLGNAFMEYVISHMAGNVDDGWS